jgi:hypothetical protein
MLSRMASRSAKHNRRIDSLCHEASANFVNFARRQCATRIIYDDSCREYLASFPWAKLAEYLTYKTDEAHIAFSLASAKAKPKSP